MHFFLYASSTDGGKVGGIAPAATARRERLLAVFFFGFVSGLGGSLNAIAV